MPRPDVGPPSPHRQQRDLDLLRQPAHPGAVDPGELRRCLARRLPSYKVPRAVHVVDALPRNATGKILRRSLVSRIELATEHGP